MKKKYLLLIMLLVISTGISPKDILGASKGEMIYTFISTINSENQVGYDILGENYITIIFELNTVNEDNGSYNGITMYGIDEILGTELYPSTIGVKFNELTKNKRYNIRMRSIRELGDGTEANESYEIEISDNVYFDNSRKVVVGDYVEKEDDSLEVLKSSWSRTLEITTKGIDGEIFNIDLFELQGQEYKEKNVNGVKTYSYSGDEIYYKEKLISKLLSSDENEYTVDMSDDVNTYKRILEMPREVLENFITLKSDLKIRGKNVEIVLNEKSIKDILSKAVVGSNVHFIFEEINNIYGYIKLEDIALSTPEKVEIEIEIDDGKKIKVDSITNGIYINVYPNTKNIFGSLNINLYTRKSEGRDFQIIPSKEESNIYSFTTKKLGIYFILGKTTPKGTNGNSELTKLNKKLLIKDIKYFYTDSKVNTTQFNNLVYAIARKEKEVSLNKRITKEKYNFLGKSKLLISGKYVSYEQGINSLVRLLELKEGYKIEVSNGTKLINENKVDRRYLKNMEKALEIGLIGNNIDYKKNMSLNDLISYLNIITQ